VCVHHIQRHLNGIECKTVVVRGLEHRQVNLW
jgi:hypothetical protein